MRLADLCYQAIEQVYLIKWLVSVCVCMYVCIYIYIYIYIYLFIYNRNAQDLIFYNFYHFPET